MKQMNFLSAFKSVSSYKKKDIKAREFIQNKRLHELVEYAKLNSPYFKELYSNIKPNFHLSELPVTNKIQMMEYFDEWVTDKTIHLSEIKKFMENKDNIGRLFNNKYIIFTTSGSTGSPAIVVYDKQAENIMSAIGILRSYARREDMFAFIKRGGKSAGVYASGGFFLGNSMIRKRQIDNPRKAKQVTIVDVLKPLDEIVNELNKFKPAMLGGYPTALTLLANEQKMGRLHINPVIVMAGGEFIDDSMKKNLRETFMCYAQSSYSCTEGGLVSCECIHGHYHLNDDFIILEPVYKDNTPVPNGKLSDKWLMTNLSNFTQPFIRYEITDRVILHEKCPCGNISPWVEVEGRTDDILTFKGINKDVQILPLALYAVLKEIDEISRFQIVLHKENNVEVRLLSNDAVKSFEKAKVLLTEYLKKNNVYANIYLSQELPQNDPISGKFKHVYVGF